MPPPEKRRDDDPRPASRRPAREPEDDEDEDRPRSDGGLSTLIPYKNGMALAAYYCGFLGLLPALGIVLCPLALIFGIIALRRVSANPAIKGTGHAIVGIVLSVLGVPLQLVYGALAIPLFLMH